MNSFLDRLHLAKVIMQMFSKIFYDFSWRSYVYCLWHTLELSSAIFFQLLYKFTDFIIVSSNFLKVLVWRFGAKVDLFQRIEILVL